MNKKRRSRKRNNDISQERRDLVQSIQINSYHNNAREILDSALYYSNRLSDELTEYREQDLKRYMVNEVRHRQTTYENGLKRIYNITREGSKATQDVVYKMYKNATLERISQVYPYLRDECIKQKYKVNMVRVVINNRDGNI